MSLRLLAASHSWDERGMGEHNVFLRWASQSLAPASSVLVDYSFSHCPPLENLYLESEPGIFLQAKHTEVTALPLNVPTVLIPRSQGLFGLTVAFHDSKLLSFPAPASQLVLAGSFCMPNMLCYLTILSPQLSSVWEGHQGCSVAWGQGTRHMHQRE